MGKIIAFANQKGGVGKTTSAVNTAASLGLLGKRVLMVDLDPQGNTTSGLGVAKKGLRMSVKEVFGAASSGLTEDKLREAAESAIVVTKFQNLSVIPATISLSGAEFDLFSYEGSQFFLKNALDTIRDSYDYIVIDCPPSLGMLTVCAMAACDGMVVPMQCEFYSLEGLSQLMITVSRIRQRYNQALDVTGILLTMYNGRLLLTTQVVSELKKHYGNKLFRTTISRGVRLAEAPSFGMPIWYLDRNSKGAQEYLNVARELTDRI